MPWTIKNKVNNLWDKGDYDLRLEEVTLSKAKNENDEKSFPTMRFKWVSVGGNNDGATQMQTFPMDPNLIGILGKALAGTGQFDEDEDMPDEPEVLARVIEDRCAGKVYSVTYGHRTDKKTGDVWPNIIINGPTTSNFR